jgi:Apea-like HEPN
VGTKGGPFSKADIEREVEELYALEDEVVEIAAEERELSPQEEERFEQRRQHSQEFFQSLADTYYKLGIYKSQEEARGLLPPNTEVLHQHAGGGFRPHDGTLEPDEIADSIYQLQYENTYSFQAPICFRVEHAVDIPFHHCNAHFRLTSKYDNLVLVNLHEEWLRDERFRDDGSNYYIWLEGSVVARRYDSAINAMDQSLRSCMGILNVLGLVKYEEIPRISCTAAIGFRSRIDIQIFYTMRSLETSRRMRGFFIPEPDNEVDAARNQNERLAKGLRLFSRAMSDESEAGEAVRHACRMFLRSLECWNRGEAAMFLSTTLEGLLLDKKQKDDLSARLQDSVAYWLGGSSLERDRIRKYVSDLYKARSNFVHNGIDAPSHFDLEKLQQLTRSVIRRELLTLQQSS